MDFGLVTVCDPVLNQGQIIPEGAIAKLTVVNALFPLPRLAQASHGAIRDRSLRDDDFRGDKFHGEPPFIEWFRQAGRVIDNWQFLEKNDN
jgi:hypothetical protein